MAFAKIIVLFCLATVAFGNQEPKKGVAQSKSSDLVAEAATYGLGLGYAYPYLGYYGGLGYAGYGGGFGGYGGYGVPIYNYGRGKGLGGYIGNPGIGYLGGYIG